MKFGKIKRYLFFGGGVLLIELTKLLRNQNQDIVVITSQRHSQELIGTKTLSQILKELKISYYISLNINLDKKVLQLITSQTLGISIGAAWIFKPIFIKLFSGKLVNLHGSRLPLDRGAGGFSWRILRDDRLGCSLIHQVDGGIDTGKIIVSEQYTFPASCRTPLQYSQYATSQYISLFKKFIKDIQNKKEFVIHSQSENQSTYWPRLATNFHGFINWSWNVKEIERFICAFDDPYPGASTFINQRQVHLKQCFLQPTDNIFHPFQTGLIYRIYKQKIFVASVQGNLVIKKVTDEKGNDILRHLLLGDRFYTPIRYLEKALTFRAVYTPNGLKK